MHFCSYCDSIWFFQWISVCFVLFTRDVPIDVITPAKIFISITSGVLKIIHLSKKSNSGKMIDITMHTKYGTCFCATEFSLRVRFVLFRPLRSGQIFAVIFSKFPAKEWRTHSAFLRTHTCDKSWTEKKVPGLLPQAILYFFWDCYLQILTAGVTFDFLTFWLLSQERLELPFRQLKFHCHIFHTGCSYN